MDDIPKPAGVAQAMSGGRVERHVERAVVLAGEINQKVQVLLGDEDAIHGLALVCGLVAIFLGRRRPSLLALALSLSVGLWVGLIVQERLSFPQPLFGVYKPKAGWEPIAFCVGAALWAGGLVYLAKRTALAMMTAGLCMLLSLTFLRLGNIPPAATQMLGPVILPLYGVVGFGAFVGSFVCAGVMACGRKLDFLVVFCSAHVGLLLLLSGASHFVVRHDASSMPFSLLDELTRIVADAQDGRCFLWQHGVATAVTGSSSQKMCDCAAVCRNEIVTWIIGSWLMIGWNYFCNPVDQQHAYSSVALDEVGIGSSGLELSRPHGGVRGARGGPRSGRMGSAPAWEASTPRLGSVDAAYGQAYAPYPQEPPSSMFPHASMLGRGAVGPGWNTGGNGYFEDQMGYAPQCQEGQDVQGKLRILRGWLEEGLISLADFETKKREVLTSL